MNTRMDSSSLHTPIFLPEQPKKKEQEMNFGTLKHVRAEVEKQRQEIKKKKAAVEYEQTVKQLERVQLTKIKSKHSRKQLETAYLAYSPSKTTAKKALQDVKKQGKKPT
eukprot:m.294215 g.294215  ORF g.294215 m.294215 type:complete len:109 (+) comp15849_c0_seq9:1474-1800(+)